MGLKLLLCRVVPRLDVLEVGKNGGYIPNTILLYTVTTGMTPALKMGSVESHSFNVLLTPSLPWCHLKTTNKSRKFEVLKPFCMFFALACERILIKTHTIEIRFVIGAGNALFSGAYLHCSAWKLYVLGQ